MKKALFLIILCVSFFSLVSANSYSIEFNQIGNNLFVTEKVNNNVVNNYTTTEGLTASGDNLYFLNKIVFEDNYSNVEIKLKLEKGVFIKNQEVFPVGYKIETDGQSISIIWSLNNIQNGDVLASFVNLERSGSKGSYVYLIILIILVILVSLIFLIKKKSKVDGNCYLLESEKKVIAVLSKAEKQELWQKQIQIATGFSKAKLSRLIRNLESRGLISRTAMGNTNKIKLR